MRRPARRSDASAGFAAILFAFCLAACGSAQPALSEMGSSTDVPSPTASPSATATTAPTATPSPSPTETAVPSGFEQTRGGWLWHGVDASGAAITLTVPDLAEYGLQPRLSGEKLIYVDAKGTYRGEYQPYLSVENHQTGGLSLQPTIVSQMIQQKLSAIAKPSDRFVVPIPLDIRQATVTTGLEVEGTVGYGKLNVGLISIGFAGTLPVTNFLPGTTEARVVIDSIYGYAYYNHKRGSLEANPESNLFAMGPFEGFTDNTTVNAPFGSKVCDAKGRIVLSIQHAMAWRDLRVSNLLTVENPDNVGLPVAVAQ
jgi:hypothetical protein